METTQKAPPIWGDKRLAEACARQGSNPTAFGQHAQAWRCASISFMEAARARDMGKPERAVELRSSGFAALHAAGLRVEQAITGQHLDDALGHTEAEEQPGVHRVQAMAECTARELHLRGRADAAGAHFAERASVEYAAASCYQRAVRAYNGGRHQDGDAWVRAAEQALTNGLVPAPWHRNRVPDEVNA
jgi:hypothetical protein